MPRRGLVRISEQRDRFEALGVKVMADRYEMVSLLNNKVEAYRFFSENGIAQVPDYRLVQTSAEFEQAYRELSGKYAQVCFKFVRDEGGKSFRLIDNERKGYTALFKKQNTRMTYDDAFAALSERETFAPMMVMPFLPGDEVSVDCLNTAQGLMTVCPGRCERDERPLACRLFPLLPLPGKDGGIRVVTDQRAKAVCPLARQGKSAMDPAFREAVREAGEILAAEDEQASFLRMLAQEQEELKLLRQMMGGGRHV